MGITTKRRGGVGGSIASVKGKKNDEHILLARGLSARYPGANVPLSGLTAEEMERDLRHMEAFSNACIAYSQQFFIYQNSKNNTKNDGDVGASSSDNNNNSSNNSSNNNNNANAANGNNATFNHRHPHHQPLVTMPVRIDPEEEKRLLTLRQKIQHCEAQREVLESQYLSLRAHYVYISQVLKKLRVDVNHHVGFLQNLVKKRGNLVALQRVRLAIARDVLQCLQYRQMSGATNNKDSKMEVDGDGIATSTAAGTAEAGGSAKKRASIDPSIDLMDVWNEIDDQFKKAEQECRENGLEKWDALKMPLTPPGVPIFLSQQSKCPGKAAAYGTNGIFGSSKQSMCWLERNLPDEPLKEFDKITRLREEAAILRADLERERTMNKELQINIIGRRKRNDELVAMMTLLRTETEAVVTRHNILLESDQAKDAAYSLHQEEQEIKESTEKERPSAAATTTPAVATSSSSVVSTTPRSVSSSSIATPNSIAPPTINATTESVRKTNVPVKEEEEGEEDDDEDEGAESGEVDEREEEEVTTPTSAGHDAKNELSGTSRKTSTMTAAGATTPAVATTVTTTTKPTTTTAKEDNPDRPNVQDDDENDGDDEGEVGEEDEDEEGEILEDDLEGSAKRGYSGDATTAAGGTEGGDDGASLRTAKRRKL